MTFDDEEEPKDWEIEEESPPEKLRKKWDKDDLLEKMVECPACKKRQPQRSLNCLFCGARIFEDSGLLGKILKWIRGKR